MLVKLHKLVKTIFSRVFLVALTVIAQVILIYYFSVELSQRFPYIQTMISIVGLIVFVLIVNKKTNPEHKLIWACLVIFLPLLGIVLYSLFSLNTISKKKINKYTKVSDKAITKPGSYKEEVYNIAKEYQGQFKYIEKMSGLNVYKNTNVTYIKDGQEFYESLLNDLKSAKKFIFMEYFIVNHGKMWDDILQVLKDKVKEGVEVRFIYDDLGCAKYLRGNYYKELRSYGIKCYKHNTMIPLVSSYHNNRDHRKITIIDGNIGYTGGINLSDEYMNINSPFGYWKDNALRMKGEAVDNLTVMFLQTYALASLKKQDCEPYLYKNNVHEEIVNDEIIIPYGTGPVDMYYNNMAFDVFLHLINQAKVSIDISTPYLIIDAALTNALIAASARGVKVRILIPSKPDKKLVYEFAKATACELIKFGVEIYTFTPGFNHAKSFLVDDKIAFVGTTNLDFRSLIHHYECGALIYNCKCMKDIDTNFEQDYLKSKLVSVKDLKRNVFVRMFVSFLRIFQSLL